MPETLPDAYIVSMQVDKLNFFLDSNKLHAKCISMSQIGQVDRFTLQTDHLFRFNKLKALSQELMLNLHSQSLPTFSLQDGELCLDTVQRKAEIPSLIASCANLNEIRTDEQIPLYLGMSETLRPVLIDMVKNPHLLIGGSTGSGKSSLLHNIIFNLFMHSDCNIFIADTKGVEFANYQKLSDRFNIVENIGGFLNVLRYLVHIMERRYALLKKNSALKFKPLVLMIDEFADLVMQDDENKTGYNLLCRLVQKCRAAGIYCILATQRPSVDIITGTIKANFPARIALGTASGIDSRIVINKQGAENLSIGQAIISNYKYDLDTFNVFYNSVDDLLGYYYESLETSL